MCKCIKEKKNCIPTDELDNIVLAMYLNIIEYINEEKQKELMEMIGLAEKIEGILSEIKNKSEKDGIKKGKREIIQKLLNIFTEDEVSNLLGIEKATLLNILQK